jgi:hypothetical protein
MKILMTATKPFSVNFKNVPIWYILTLLYNSVGEIIKNFIAWQIYLAINITIAVIIITVTIWVEVLVLVVVVVVVAIFAVVLLHKYKLIVFLRLMFQSSSLQ